MPLIIVVADNHLLHDGTASYGFDADVWLSGKHLTCKIFSQR